MSRCCGGGAVSGALVLGRCVAGGSVSGFSFDLTPAVPSRLEAVGGLSAELGRQMGAGRWSICAAG